MDESSDRTLVAVEVVDECLRQQQLKSKQICRFCLSQDAPLSSIFDVQCEKKMSKTPLTLQIMACVSIEVFAEDGLPGMICGNCHVLMIYYYQFKQICKNADTSLKGFLSTGIWPEKLTVPKELLSLVENSKSSAQKISTRIEKPVVNDATPATGNDKEKEKKVNIITISPADLKNYKQGHRVTMINPETPPATGRKTAQSNMSGAAPLHASTPIPKHTLPDKRSHSTTELHEPPRVHGQGQRGHDGQLQKKSTKSPVILNKLANSFAQQKVKEEFVSTGDGTVEMVLKFQSESPETVQMNGIFPCTECNRTFKLKQLLDIHKLIHKRERNFPCDSCDKRFFSKYDLAKHTATHTGERPYVCVICRAAFSRSTLLTRHQALHKDDLTHPCMFCERVFVSSEELNKHSQIHEKHRPFKCGSCPKSFAYKQGLERHEGVHKKELPCKCEYCDMSFRTPGMLSRHLTAHAGSRPYPCRLCKKSFLMSHHLSRHLRAHNTMGQSEYKCTDCSKMFTSKNDLIYHSAKHATENLICPLCREQFEDIDEVTEHIQMHATGVAFACDYCDLMYTNEQKLADHCQEQHENELAYEWSEEQQKQLNQEEEDAQNDGENKSPGKAHILMEGEMVVGNVLLECVTIEADGTENNIYLNEQDTKTEEFVDQYDCDQVLETFEVTEFVDISAVEPSPSTTIVQKLNPPSPKKPTAIKVEGQTSATTNTARQKSMDDFFKRNEEAVQKKTAQRKVSEMLKKLPKGVTIKRELPKPSVAAPGSSRASMKAPPPVEMKGEPAIERGKSVVLARAPPKDSSTENEKRIPGRPAKVDEQGKAEIDIKKENAATQDGNKEMKRAKSDLINKKEITEKKVLQEGGLKRSGTMNFPKSRLGSDDKPKTAPCSGAASENPTQMVRRSYAAAAPEKRVAVGTKRAAEEQLDKSNVTVPSKRLAADRKTLNPSMLVAIRSAAKKSGEKSDETVRVNIVRTMKRVPKSDGPVGAPIEMNVGGKKIKMQKLMLSKDEALALQQAGKLKSKV